MSEGLAHLGTPVAFWACSSLLALPGKWPSPGGLGSLHPEGTLGPLWLPLARWGASFGLTGPLLFPQLGLLVDLSSDGLMIPEDGVNNEELEAEFLALVGGQPQALEKLKGKGPLPMEAIEKMASLCMKDLDEDEGTDEEDVEADDDLLVSIQGGAGGIPMDVAPSIGPSHRPPALCPCRPN